MSHAVSKDFQSEVIEILPRLRAQALSLTRNPSAADDLVQDAVCNAISSQHTFIPGTNFSAWMHRIVRNRFISNLRKCRDTVEIDDAPVAALMTLAPHEDRLLLKELEKALVRLPPDQLEALTMVVIQGMSYQELADLSDCAIGTAKSRVFRARGNLQVWLRGEKPDAGNNANAKPLRASCARQAAQAHVKHREQDLQSVSYG